MRWGRWVVRMVIRPLMHIHTLASWEGTGVCVLRTRFHLSGTRKPKDTVSWMLIFEVQSLLAPRRALAVID
jgi:hypothetical protein